MNKDIYLPSNFEKSSIESYLMYDLNVKSKFRNSLNYVLSKMHVHHLIDDLEELPWEEGKNYRWVAIISGELKMLIRAYRTHFTFFVKLRVKMTGDEEEEDFFYTKYGCFEFFSKTEDLKNSDEYVENNCLDLNSLILPLIDVITNRGLYWVSNSASLFRLKHIEIRNIWDGGDNITSIDKFIFAMEELDEKHLEKFAKHETLEHLKTYNVGDKLGKYPITRIQTEVKNNYYHAVGLEIEKNGQKCFEDIFSLTRWYCEDFFKTKKDYDGLLLLSEDSE